MTSVSMLNLLFVLYYAYRALFQLEWGILDVFLCILSLPHTAIVIVHQRYVVWFNFPVRETLDPIFLSSRFVAEHSIISIFLAWTPGLVQHVWSVWGSDSSEAVGAVRRRNQPKFDRQANRDRAFLLTRSASAFFRVTQKIKSATGPDPTDTPNLHFWKKVRECPKIKMRVDVEQNSNGLSIISGRSRSTFWVDFNVYFRSFSLDFFTKKSGRFGFMFWFEFFEIPLGRTSLARAQRWVLFCV